MAKKMDRLLVKEINRYRYKLESHETIKWRILRKWELERQYKRTTKERYCIMI